MKIIFDESTHTYWGGDKQIPNFSMIKQLVMGDEGDMLRRIVPTSQENAMSIYQSDGQIMLNDLPAEAHEFDNAFYRERGKDIHKMIELYVKDGETMFFGFSDESKAYMPAFAQFVKDHEIVWHDSEGALYNNEHGYCCTADLICTIDGIKTVIDVKSGQIKAWHLVQLQAQKSCLEDVTQAQALYLHSKPNKNGKLYTIVTAQNEHKTIWDSFITVYSFKVTPRTRKHVPLKPNLLNEKEEKNESI
jgi:hypothetical protein